MSYRIHLHVFTAGEIKKKDGIVNLVIRLNFEIFGIEKTLIYVFNLSTQIITILESFDRGRKLQNAQCPTQLNGQIMQLILKEDRFQKKKCEVRS